MKYLFKLTKRLALAGPLAILVAGFTACSSGDRSVTAPGDDTARALRSGSATTVASVSVTPSSAAGSLGQSAQFTATAHNASGGTVNGVTVTWTSTDSTIVAVNSSGFATAIGVGSANIIATVGSAHGQAAATVGGDPIASISVSPTTVSGTVGQTAPLTATLTGASGSALSGRRVLWSSSNHAVVMIDTSGFASGVSNGTATITATSGGKSATANVTVGTGAQSLANPSPVTDLTIASIADSTATLSFTQVSDGSGRPAAYEIRYAVAPISWGSAAVVAKGTCTTPLAGTSIGSKLSCTVNGLTASTAYNFQVVAFRGTLNVNAVFGALSNPLAATTTTTAPPPSLVSSVAVTPGSASGSVGQSAQFSATVKDASGNVMSGQAVTWASSNTAVVTVSNTGYATAMGGGSAMVTATVGGKSGQAPVTVTGTSSGGTVTSVSVAPLSATLAVGATQQLGTTLKDVIGNILTALTVSWSSSNPAVATVNGSGLVTGISAGSATVTATSGGVSSSSSITISSSSTAPPPSSSGWINAPSAYPTLSENSFDALDVLNWHTTWNTAGLLTVGSDASAPVSPNGVLQFSYPIGFVGSKAPAMEYFDFPQRLTSVYGGISWKANANWQGNSSNVNKIEFVYMDGGAGDVFLCAYGQPGGPYEIRTALEIPGADTRDMLAPNKANVTFAMGTWHRIEWQIVYNTTTSPANGIMRWWLDGQLVGEYTDILFPTAPMEEYQISPTFGGMPDVKTQNDYFWFDHVIVKGKP